MSFRSEKKEQEGLEKLCDELISPDSVVIEIGSYFGESTLYFAKSAAEVFCIDPWQDYEDNGKKFEDMVEAEAHFDVNTSELRNVHKFRTSSFAAAQVMGPKVAELVYIDSRTTYDSVKQDINIWWPKIKNGGVISGHNYHLPSVKKAVDEFFGKPDRIYVDNSWVVTKFPGRWKDEEK